MNSISVTAPAKINMGLEILGLRNDGFHEIRSVIATISLFDTLTFASNAGPSDQIAIGGVDQDIPREQNLVLLALKALRESGARIPPQHITLTKRIPVASGLGGASSDAAATLRHFAFQLDVPQVEISRIAATLGSDVPFFLGAPFAIARGRGDQLTALPPPNIARWVVTVTPDISVSTKTATMYREINRGRWTSGERVEQFAASFPTPPRHLPPNTFARVLFSRFPKTADNRDKLLRAGFPFVAVTGAGPTLFTICESELDAIDFSQRATAVLPSGIVHASQVGAAPISSEVKIDRQVGL